MASAAVPCPAPNTSQNANHGEVASGASPPTPDESATTASPLRTGAIETSTAPRARGRDRIAQAAATSAALSVGTRIADVEVRPTKQTPMTSIITRS